MKKHLALCLLFSAVAPTTCVQPIVFFGPGSFDIPSFDNGPFFSHTRSPLSAIEEKSDQVKIKFKRADDHVDFFIKNVDPKDISVSVKGELLSMQLDNTLKLFLAFRNGTLTITVEEFATQESKNDAEESHFYSSSSSTSSRAIQFEHVLDLAAARVTQNKTKRKITLSVPYKNDVQQEIPVAVEEE